MLSVSYSYTVVLLFIFFFSSRRRHTRLQGDWSSDVCSSDLRQLKGNPGISFVPTWVGFKGEKHKQGERRPSTEWPIQRYIWSDYGVQAGQGVRYRATPMIGPAGHLSMAPRAEWSRWTPWVRVGTGQTNKFEAYFNRGIV